MYRPTTRTHRASQVTVRVADRSDASSLARLAALDSAEALVGVTLLAEVNGETVAAVPLRGGRAIADPFRRTAAAIELLELRAAQLRGEARPGSAAGSYAGRLRALVRAPHSLPLG